MSDLIEDQWSGSEPEDAESVGTDGEEDDSDLNKYEQDGFIVNSDEETKKHKKKKKKRLRRNRDDEVEIEELEKELQELNDNIDRSP